MDGKREKTKPFIHQSVNVDWFDDWHINLLEEKHLYYFVVPVVQSTIVSIICFLL